MMIHARKIAGWAGLLSWCVIFVPVLAADSVAEQASGEDLLTLERIFTAKEFEAEELGPTQWLEDGSGYTALEESSVVDGQDIVRYISQTGVRSVLVTASQLVPKGRTQPLEIEDYRFSKDARKVLIFTNTEQVWRKNTRGDYWVLDLDGGRLSKLGEEFAPAGLMFAKFSPDAKQVAYVCRGNIYVEDIPAMRIRQLTTDASDTIINGTSDWVYEEEFGLRDAFRWSPDGRWIAYWQFDTEGVGEFHLINYTDSLYPQITSFRYPKVGRQNPACRIGVISSRGGETRWFSPQGDPRQHYIPTMAWAGDSRTIVFQRMNRLQNTNEVILADTRNGRMHNVLTERDDAWLDAPGDIDWVDEGRSFLWLSERDGWRHLYLVSCTDGRTQLLTPGQSDVITLGAVDKKGGWVYYTASPQNPTQRYLYRAPLDAGGGVERVTPPEQAGAHGYDISDDAAWAFHRYAAFGAPPAVEVVSLPNHQSVQTLVNNAELRQKLGKLKKGNEEFFRVDIGGGVTLDGWCIKPPDFDPEKKYPVLFYVYGEPAGQTVTDDWGGQKYLWHRMLAQQGYIVMSVDNRGTPAPRGRWWRKCVYRKIGIIAPADQASAVREIIKKRPYIDPERIGIWGWSGGGSMSLNAIFRYPEIYTTAIAIAFVSDQRFYDTIYQERYMGLPEDNEQGYNNGSPINFAHQLRGDLLIIHGTADDNCHYQNCEALVNKLIEHNKHFTMMSYPNRNHSIDQGENTRRHLYELMTGYLKEHLPAGPE